MCNVCGCGQGEARIEGQPAGHEGTDPHGPRHGDGTVHAHPHGHAPHAHACHGEGPFHPVPLREGVLHFGLGPAHAHAPGLSQARMVRIEQDILAKNDAYAARNRQWLAEKGIFAVNLVSSPGSGKTTLLVKTIEALGRQVPVAVIEGDQQTSMDAERIRATGAPAIQVNTGRGCHLDAHMVGHALEHLRLLEEGLLLIENVGNLVCPAGFDLGEAHKVVILSVTEGEDKPLKYQDIFRAASLMLLNKADLLPHVTFDVKRCIAYARRINPRLEVLRVSALTGEGLADWTAWLRAGLEAARAARPRNSSEPGRRPLDAAAGGAPGA